MARVWFTHLRSFYLCLQLYAINEIFTSFRPPRSSCCRKRCLVMYSITFILCITSLFFTQAVPAVGALSRQLTSETPATYPSSTLNSLKVPGESPAYHCSDPSDDIFQIHRFDFIPTNVRMYVLHSRKPSIDSFTNTHTFVQRLLPHSTFHRHFQIRYRRLPMAQHHRQYQRAPRIEPTL